MNEKPLLAEALLAAARALREQADELEKLAETEHEWKVTKHRDSTVYKKHCMRCGVEFGVDDTYPCRVDVEVPEMKPQAVSVEIPSEAIRGVSTCLTCGTKLLNPSDPCKCDEQPDTIPAPPVTTTWQSVAKAYQVRYEKKRNMAWFYANHVQWLKEIADWIDAQAQHEGADPRAVGKQLLDNFFADSYAMSVEYRPKLLAGNPGQFYRPEEPGAEPDAEDKAKRRAELEAEYQEAKRKAEERHMRERGLIQDEVKQFAEALKEEE